VPGCPQQPATRKNSFLPPWCQHPQIDDHSSNQSHLACNLTSGGFHPTVMLTPSGGGVPCLYLISFGAYPEWPSSVTVRLQKGIIEGYVGKVRGNHLPAVSVLLALSRTCRDVVACSGSATCRGFETSMDIIWAIIISVQPSVRTDTSDFGKPCLVFHEPSSVPPPNGRLPYLGLVGIFATRNIHSGFLFQFVSDR